MNVKNIQIRRVIIVSKELMITTMSLIEKWESQKFLLVEHKVGQALSRKRQLTVMETLNKMAKTDRQKLEKNKGMAIIEENNLFTPYWQLKKRNFVGHY